MSNLSPTPPPFRLRRYFRVCVTLALFLTATLDLLAQSENQHHHESIGWVPRALLERTVSLRTGIGNLHEKVDTKSSEAQAYYDQGLNYLHDYEWIEAARSFHQALRLDPHITLAYLGLSEVYTQLQDNTAARAACTEAQTLAETSTPRDQIRVGIRVAQLDFLEDASGNMQKYFAWRKTISDALGNDPTNPQLWILRAFSDEGTPAPIGQGGRVDSIAFYETALAHSPDNFAAHHYLAHTYENLDRTQDALSEAEAFVRLAPAIPHAHHMRGHELRRLGRTPEAIQEFLKADEIERSYYQTEKIPAEYDWHHAHNLSLLAISYEALGQMKAAEPALRAAFKAPAYTDISEFNHREWPDFLLARGRPEEALSAALEMVEKSSWAMGKFAGHALAGQAYLAMNRIDDARNELRLAEQETEHISAALLHSLPNAWILRGELLLHDQRFPEARAILKPIEADVRAMPGPDSWSETSFQLEAIARVAREFGDWQLAEFTAQQMIQHDSSFASGHYALALACEHSGDSVMARDQFMLAGKLWSQADSDLPELAIARAKVAAK